MSHVIVAVPGARAGRRLRELLALAAQKVTANGRPMTLLPPRIVTSGELPEALYTPKLPIASPLEVLMAWSDALRQVSPEIRNQFFGTRDGRVRHEADPVLGLNLASELAAVSAELAAERVPCSALQSYCDKHELAHSAARWGAFAAIEQRHRETLSALCRIGRDQARELALAEGLPASDSPIILLATPDLPAITRQMLLALPDPSRVIALVHAPQSESKGFDPLGCLTTDYWEAAPIPIADSQIEIVDTVPDLALAVAQIAQRLPKLAPEAITVGLGDDTQGAPIERAIELVGLPARRAAGRPLAGSAPAQALQALASYLAGQHAAHFAALVRHPDMAVWLARVVPSSTTAGEWPDICDNYLTKHLPVTVGKDSNGLPDPLAQAVRAIEELAGADCAKRRPIGEWAGRIAQILGAVYEGDHPPEEAGAPLSLLGAALAELSYIGRETPLPRGALPDAIGFLLATCGKENVPAESDRPQIELVGWLEVHLDDAPALILAGVNEGYIPQSVPIDPFLPDSLRTAVNLTDNRRRFSRDAYVLRATLASRQMVQLIASRARAQGEPLAPSRLLLAGDPEEIATRVLAFYGEPGTAEPPCLLPHGDINTLATLPQPHPRGRAPIAKLAVTAFRDYLACPYRFYLKHVLGLAQMRDGQVEMGGDLFGTLMHDVLKGFGRWVVDKRSGKPPTDSKEINRELQERLAKLARERFGEPMHPAVAIQIDLLGRRLAAFAKFQAQETQDGWTIRSVEYSDALVLDVDGADFTVDARIDRIDYHPATRRYRIIDYKSGDAGADPQMSHRSAGAWTDLQLPLYRRLAATLNIPEGAVDVGYIVLPKDSAKVGFVKADWDEALFRDAYLAADDVIRHIREGVFWPPGAPGTYDDGLAAICLDHALDRESIILRGPGPPAVWEEEEAPTP